MKQNKALSLISLATKAGRTVSGEFSTEKAVKNKGLERSFKQAIPKEVYEKLEKEMNALEIE